MSVNAATHYAQQYATNIALLLQQQGSKIRQAVTTGSHVGKAASPVDQIGSIEAIPAGGRFTPMGRVDAALDRRWVYPVDWELPQLIDSFDKLKILTDPQSAYVQNAVNALGRKMDAAILAAINGTAKTGVEGGTSTTLPSGQKVAVGFGAASSTGLTVAKLREAKRILMAADLDVEREQLFCVVKAKQHDNLLAEMQVISLDFNEKPVMMEGRVTRFLGINLIHSELLEASGSNDLCPVFAKSGVYMGIWNDIETNISQRVDLSSMPWQAYAKASFGATRLEEERVVQITCA